MDKLTLEVFKEEKEKAEKSLILARLQLKFWQSQAGSKKNNQQTMNTLMQITNSVKELEEYMEFLNREEATNITNGTGK